MTLFPRSVLAVLLCLAGPMSQALADADPQSYCRWLPGSSPMTMEYNLDTRYVPLNARVGDFIGPPDKGVPIVNNERYKLQCRNEGDVVMTFTLNASRPPIVLGHSATSNPIIPTNVPGIGAVLRLESPFSGDGTSDFLPVAGSTYVPFVAQRKERHNFSHFELYGMYHYVTLVKTGELPPGIHHVDAEMFTGHLDFNNIGLALRYRLRGTVIQSQCSIGHDAVMPNPVDLGEWEQSAFTGPGFTTTPAAFQITLSACQTDPDQNAVATLELTGKNGSTPIGPGDQGILGLTTDSDAQGVGIQLLKEDGTPMPLDKEQSMVALSNGTTVMKLKAHYIQTENRVKAGKANGALNFTVRYR